MIDRRKAGAIDGRGFRPFCSLTDEGQKGWGIFALRAKTGYVVLRIEPRSESRPYRASSAFPSRTPAMHRPEALRALYGWVAASEQ